MEVVLYGLARKAELEIRKSLATSRTLAGSPVKSTRMPIGTASDRHLLITPTPTCFQPNAKSGFRKRETPLMFESKNRTSSWPRSS